MLTLVATPIGNLGDISLRAIEALGEAELILCEDTRHSRPLLQKHGIDCPLKSYHMFNEAESIPRLVEEMLAGKRMALISDAGTPGISDPGERLVQACIDAGVPVTAVPGPCALVHALICSGLDSSRFQFLGFVPKKASERNNALKDALHYPGTSIFYESPRRLLSTISAIGELDAQRQVVVARELTKAFETFHRGTPEELLAQWADSDPRGECVLLVAGGSRDDWSDLSLEDHVSQMEGSGLSRSDAIKEVAKMRGLPKRQVYQAVHGGKA